MSDLTGAKVRRGGVTANRWYDTINDVSIRSADTVRIRFVMASKGGGDTEVQLEIPPKGFPAILKAMAEVDREATLQAASLELARQLSSPTARQEAFNYEGESRVLDAARRKYRKKAGDDSEREQATYHDVGEIVHAIVSANMVPTN